MRAFIDGAEYSGTPIELADFLYMREERFKTTEEATATFTPDDFAPLEATISESEMLRKKLAENADYNPFPGVSPSPDSPVSAEHDTGVKFE